MALMSLSQPLLIEIQRRLVVASSRRPDIISFGLSPLCHREADVRELACRLEKFFQER